MTSSPTIPVASLPASASNWTCLLLHVNLSLYAFFWWFNQPVFPYLSKQLGADPVTIGTLQSWNQLVMFCGTLFIGRFMDARGARSTLIASHVFGAASYFLLSFASSIPLLFLSQIPTAFMSAMHSSQTLITLLTTTEERSKSLGRLSLSYGIGFVLGPACGGLATNYLSYAQLASISAVASILVAVEIYLFVPDIRAEAVSSTSPSNTSPNTNSSPSSNSSASSPSATSSASYSLTPALSLLSNPTVRSVMLVKLICVFSISLFRSSFFLMSQESGLTAQDQGFLLSFIGGVTIVVNSFFIQPLTSRYSDGHIAFYSILLTTASFISFLWLPMRYPLILIWILPLTTANSAVATVLTGSMTKLSSQANAGAMLGFDMAVGSGSRMASPLLGALLVNSGMQGLGGLCAAITGTSLAFLNNAFPESSTGKQVATSKEEKEKVT